jgi:hypothetical protein
MNATFESNDASDKKRKNNDQQSDPLGIIEKDKKERRPRGSI